MDPDKVDPSSIGDSLSQWTQNNGLAVVLLFAAILIGCYATMKVSRWMGSNILLPLKDAAIGHLKRTDDTLSTVKDTLQEISTQMRESSTHMRDIRGDQAKILQCHEDLRHRIHCQAKPGQ